MGKRDWLKRMRKSMGATMKQVGVAAGISESHYSLIESGERRPSADIAKEIANVMGFDWTLFFESEVEQSERGSRDMMFQEMRKAARLTQQEAAEQLGVSQSTVAMWETGDNSPRAEMLPAIARLYGCTIDALFGMDADDDDYEDEDEDDDYEDEDEEADLWWMMGESIVHCVRGYEHGKDDMLAKCDDDLRSITKRMNDMLKLVPVYNMGYEARDPFFQMKIDKNTHVARIILTYTPHPDLTEQREEARRKANEDEQ